MKINKQSFFLALSITFLLECMLQAGYLSLWRKEMAEWQEFEYSLLFYEWLKFIVLVRLLLNFPLSTILFLANFERLFNERLQQFLVSRMVGLNLGLYLFILLPALLLVEPARKVVGLSAEYGLSLKTPLWWFVLFVVISPAIIFGLINLLTGNFYTSVDRGELASPE